MILDFSAQNFLSFKEKVVFSFEATRDDTHDSTHVVEVTPGVRIGKLGIIYGANASGKSNLLEAINFLFRFWRNKPETKTEGTGAIPFLLDESSRDKPSEFSVTFYIHGQKHLYDLIVSKDTVVYEKLSYYPGTQPAEIFTRSHKDNVSHISFGPKTKVSSAAKDEITVKCLANTSVFAAYEAVNVNIPELEKATSWVKKQVLPAVEPRSRLTSYVKQQLLNNKATKSFVLDFLKEADFNIANITTKKERAKIPERLLPIMAEMKMPSEAKDQLLKEKTMDTLHTTFTHSVANQEEERAEHVLPESLQSNGTIRTMGLAGVISQAIAMDAFLFIDEIESSLHPKLVEFVIEQFLSLSNQAQLLVTTHNDSLLEEADLLRNDNIWFTSKKKDGSTELYSLSDFQGLNRISSLQKAYKYGKFGATPNI